MTLLERIFGVETMARVREEARQAQARALAQSGPPVAATVRRAPVPRSIASQSPPSAIGVGPGVASTAPEIAGGFIDALPVDFPTSILGTAVAATPPLLAAFASREALLAAVVYSEALAPPLGLR